MRPLTLQLRVAESLDNISSRVGRNGGDVSILDTEDLLCLGTVKDERRLNGLSRESHIRFELEYGQAVLSSISQSPLFAP